MPDRLPAVGGRGGPGGGAGARREGARPVVGRRGAVAGRRSDGGGLRHVGARGQRSAGPVHGGALGGGAAGDLWEDVTSGTTGGGGPQHGRAGGGGGGDPGLRCHEGGGARRHGDPGATAGGGGGDGRQRVRPTEALRHGRGGVGPVPDHPGPADVVAVRGRPRGADVAAADR